MCGRFTQMFTWDQADLLLGLSGPPLNLQPRYNVAPSQDVAVVRTDRDGRRLSMLRWGLVPGWARDPRIGHAEQVLDPVVLAPRQVHVLVHTYVRHGLLGL